MKSVLLDYREDTPYNVTQSMWDGTSSEWKLGCVGMLSRIILFAYHKTFHKVITLRHVRKACCTTTGMVEWLTPRDGVRDTIAPLSTINELIDRGGLRAIDSHYCIGRYFEYNGLATPGESFTVLDQLAREPYIQALIDPALREYMRPDLGHHNNFVYSWQFQTLHDVLDCPETYKLITPEQLNDLSRLTGNLANAWSMGYDLFISLCQSKAHEIKKTPEAGCDIDDETITKFAEYLAKWFNYHAAKCWITQWEFINQMAWGDYPRRAKYDGRNKVSLTYDLPDWKCVAGTSPINRPTLSTGVFGITKIFGRRRKIKWNPEYKYGIVVAKCQNKYRYDLLVYQFRETQLSEHYDCRPVAVLRGMTGSSLLREGYYTFNPSDDLKSKFCEACEYIVDDRILESITLMEDRAPYIVANELNIVHTERDGWIPSSDLHTEQEWDLTERKILRRISELIRGHKMRHIAANYDVPVCEWAATAPDNCDLMFIYRAFKSPNNQTAREIYMLALRVFLSNTDLVRSLDGREYKQLHFLRKPNPKEKAMLRRFNLDIGSMKIANLSIADIWDLCRIAEGVDYNLIMTTYNGSYMRMLPKFLETGTAGSLNELIPDGYRPNSIGSLIQLGAKAFMAEFYPRYKMLKYKEGWFRSHLAVQKRKFGWYHYNGVNGMVQDY